MTKNTYVTNLNEINGLKIECEKCGSNWFIPIGQGRPPENCIGCGIDIPGAKIMATCEKIAELKTLSDSGKFKVLIETEMN